MYQTGLADISMGSLIYAHPFDRWGTVGIGVLYSDAGTIEVNLPGQALRNREALKDTAYTLGYGKAFANLISLGLNAKLIQSTLVEEYSDSTTSLDAGLLITPRLKGLQIGLSFLNIGKGLTYISESDPLPQTTRAGLSYTYYHLTQDEILYAFLLTADGYKTLDEQTKSGIGLEIMRNTFSIRAGYLLNKDIEGLTAGLGFGWSRYTLDYAIGFVEDLSHNHRISLNIHFAPIASELETNKQNFQHRPKNLGAQ